LKQGKRTPFQKEEIMSNEKEAKNFFFTPRGKKKKTLLERGKCALY